MGQYIFTHACVTIDLHMSMIVLFVERSHVRASFAKLP